MDDHLSDRKREMQITPNTQAAGQQETLAAGLERLTISVRLLEERVSALEQRQPGRTTSWGPAALTAPPPGMAALAMPREGGVFSILGKAMLGIAGAYMLRALAESTTLPRTPLVALGLIYAFLWLVPATRARTRLPSLAWAATSAIILLPMLWELTLRFTDLSSSLAAGVFAAWVVAASALAWKHHFAEVAWVTEAAASVASVALAISTRHFPPFLIALLLIATVGEVAAARHRTLRVRPLVAAAADFAIFALIWIYSSPAASRMEYPHVAAGLLLAFAPLLLLISAGSASTQTLILGRRISFFETSQTLVAFLLTVWAMIALWSGPGARVVGLICLAAAAAGYTIAFSGFDRAPSPRNFHVYATGSLALLLSGCWLGLAGTWLAPVLCSLAVAATLSGVRTARRTLQFHGLACLFAAAFASGLLAWAARALAWRFPEEPSLGLFIVSASAIACYSAVARTSDATWSARALRLLSAALSLGAGAALLVWGLVRVTVGSSPGAEHLALLRTLTGCALALLLAWSGSRRHRRELVWLAWTSVVCLAAKLLFEDLRHGHLAFTAASIFAYAVTLLTMPRLLKVHQGTAHRGQAERPSSATK